MTPTPGAVNYPSALELAFALPAPLAAMDTPDAWGIVLPDRAADPREAKRPRDLSGRALSSTSAAGWCDLLSAASAVDAFRERGERAFLARRLSGEGLVCVDVDGDGKDLGPAAHAARLEIEAACRKDCAWSEISMSGTGRHYWLTGEIPADIRARFARACRIEIYSTARMIIVAGGDAAGACGPASPALWTAVRASGGEIIPAAVHVNAAKWTAEEENSVLSRLEEPDVLVNAALALAALPDDVRAVVARGTDLLAQGLDASTKTRGMDWDWSGSDFLVMSALWRLTFDRATTLRAFLDSGMFRVSKHPANPIAYLLRYVMPGACASADPAQRGKGAGEAWERLIAESQRQPPPAPEPAPDPAQVAEAWGDWWSDAAPLPEGRMARGLSDILASAPRRAPMLWRNYLRASGLTLLVAPPSAGKSTLATSIAYAVATRDSYMGERIAEGAVVLYIPTEDRDGAEDRLRANAMQYGVPDAPIPLRVAERTIRFTEPEDVAAVILEIEQLRKDFPDRRGPCLLVVDTLAGAMAGADENSVKDTQPIMDDLNATLQIPAMRALLGPVSTLVVHHSGKNAANGPRGSSAIYGAADAVLRLDVEGVEDMFAAPAGLEAARVLSVQKIRGCPLIAPRRLSMQALTLGRDAYGDPVTGAVIDLAKTSKDAAEARGVDMPDPLDSITLSQDDAIFLAAAWAAKVEGAGGQYRVDKKYAGDLGGIAKDLWNAFEPPDHAAPGSKARDTALSKRLSRAGGAIIPGIRRQYTITDHGWTVAKFCHAAVAERLAQRGAEYVMPGEPPDDTGAPYVEIVWRDAA